MSQWCWRQENPVQPKAELREQCPVKGGKDPALYTASTTAGYCDGFQAQVNPRHQQKGVSTHIKEQRWEKVWKPHPCLLRASWRNEECLALKETRWQPCDRDCICLCKAEVRKKEIFITLIYSQLKLNFGVVTAAYQKHSTTAECPSVKGIGFPWNLKCYVFYLLFFNISRN